MLRTMNSPLQTCQDVILDSVNEGVFTVDHDWKVTSFNRAAEGITGIPRQEAIGRPCCEVFRASICENACAVRQALATDEAVANAAVYIVDASGNRVPIKVSAAVLRDQDGRVIGGVETFQDLRQIEELRKKLEKKYTFADIVGQSPVMVRLFDLLPKVANSESPVLIAGPSGTGKELFAQALHNLSPRRKKRFVAINCGGLPDSLLESELFGYKAGAFTDAKRDKPGRFAVANGGTLFLDEIGDISSAMQMRLLRVLQEKTFEPLGSVEPVRTNVRIVSATNKNLEELVKKGTFREDLFYRLHVVQMELPNLQQRREDIPLLIQHFLAKFNRLQGKDVSGVSAGAMARLMEYDYPGNVRELENIIEYAFVLCHEGLIQFHHLPPAIQANALPGFSESGNGLTLEAMEKSLITSALHRHCGNRRRTAKELGINPSSLYRKTKALGIEVPAKDGRSHRRND
ncbi:MAG: sigma 54-interacting transcriptional regulator [Candidatus Omnitrophica bacterium]|nr:sigma 54-interacting transcriptional regulator [Candidatus Omnitrophota bacterium]